MGFPIDRILHTILLGTVSLSLIIFVLLLVLHKGCISNPLVEMIVSKKQHKISGWIIGACLLSTIFALGISIENYVDEGTNESYYKMKAYAKVLESSSNKKNSDIAKKIDQIHEYYDTVSSNFMDRFKYFMNEKSETNHLAIFQDKNPILYRQYKDYKGHVDAFYYDAKSNVFKVSEYHNELNLIQERVNLTRTLSKLFKLFGIILLCLSIIKFALDLFYLKGTNKFRHNLIGKYYEKTYFKKVSFIFVATVGVSSIIISLFVLSTWEHEEMEYNKRVFGYYKTCLLNDKSRDSLNAISSNDLEMKTIRNNSIKLFEPSGIVRRRGTHNFVVVNDKGGIFYKYDTSSNGAIDTTIDTTSHLCTFRITDNYGDPLVIAQELEVLGLNNFAKFEALTAYYVNDTITKYTAITSHNDTAAKFNKIVHITHNHLADSANSMKQVEIATNIKSQILKVLAGTNLFPDSINYIKIEALSYLQDSILIIGVREVGNSKWDFKYTCELFTYDLKSNNIDYFLSFKTDRLEGISDLYIDRDQADMSMYILTSIERNGFINKNDEVSGNLYRIKIDSKEFEKQMKTRNWQKRHIYYQDSKSLKNRMSLSCFRIKEFSGKPEGITLFDNKKAIVVFDSDRDRKCKSSDRNDKNENFSSDDKSKNSNFYFSINQNEDFYTIFDLE